MTEPGFSVAIIGAGFAGIALAIRLKQAGIDFVILEKADRAGGTWRDNVYPGVACDVPSHHYCYSFAPNPEWSHRFAPGAEILRYLEGVIDGHGLRPHLRTGREVCDARWTQARWLLRTTAGEQIEADVVVAATGVLRLPAYPAIAGVDVFAGPVFHTARWRHDVAITGKRIGIIGTGTSAAQVIPALTGQAHHLTVFQRTPSWVVPVANPSYPAWLRRALRRVPWLLRLLHRLYALVMARLYGPALVGLRPLIAWLISAACHRALWGVRDPQLRAQLTPRFTPGCKRLVFSDRYLQALQRPDVTVTTAPIIEVTPSGVRTADQRTHEVDVLVLATGFHASAYMRPMTLCGAGGVTLEQVWADKPIAFHGVAIPHMPNFFTLVGPHSPIATVSVVEVAEWQSEHMLRCIQLIRRDRVALSPTLEATMRYQDELARAARRTLWVRGCRSWFLDKDGLPAIYPMAPLRHKANLAAPLDLANYWVEPLLPRAAGPARNAASATQDRAS